MILFDNTFCRDAIAPFAGCIIHADFCTPLARLTALKRAPPPKNMALLTLPPRYFFWSVEWYLGYSSRPADTAFLRTEYWIPSFLNTKSECTSYFNHVIFY